MSRRHLIVNADDFGMSQSVNEGVIEAHEHGIVTSASLMVRGEAAAAAAAYARSRPGLSLGLHLDLGEWVHGADGWAARYEVVPLDDRGAVEEEVHRQMTTFDRIVGRPPTHLDSHQHVHTGEPVATVLREAGRRLAVPVRHEAPAVTYRGDFYGQTGKGEPYPEGITVDSLLGVLDGLAPGWTELGCHPGRFDPGLQDVYRQERAVELSVLRDRRVRQGLEARGIALASFHDVGPAGSGR